MPYKEFKEYYRKMNEQPNLINFLAYITENHGRVFNLVNSAIDSKKNKKIPMAIKIPQLNFDYNIQSINY